MKTYLGLLLLVPSLAFAHPTPSSGNYENNDGLSGEVAVYGGPAITTLSHEQDGTITNQNHQNGTYGGEVLFDLSNRIKVGLDVSHANPGSADSQNTIVSFNSLGLAVLPTGEHREYSTDLFLGAVKIVPEDTTEYIPYFTVLAGLHRTHLNQSSTIEAPGWYWAATGTPVLTEVDETKTGTALGAALGADVPLNKTLFVGLEARYVYLSRVTYDVTQATQATGLGPNSVSMGGCGVLSAVFKLGIKF